MINVLVVDDHAIVRRGIVNILSTEEDISVTGEASCYDELFELLNKVQFDIVILDITMPGKNGLDTLIELKELYRDMKVIILSMHSDEEIIKRAFKTGCSAYLNKDGIPEELVKTIRIVINGGKYVGASLAPKLGWNYGFEMEKNPHEKLSEREFQIFCLIASGNSLTEIANKLSINVKTVGTYKSRILDKMKLRTNIEIAHYAIKNKLVVNPI